MVADRPEEAAFKRRYPRAYPWIARAYWAAIALVALEIVTRVGTYVAWRSPLRAFPEIQRRYEQSHAFYPAMTIDAVLGDPRSFPAAIPAGEGPPRIIPFGEVSLDAFRTPPRREEPTPGVARVVFMGGSTTYDGYPERVAKLVDARFGAGKVEVLNLGLPAGNTATTLVLMRRYLPTLRPHVVVIYHGFNDIVYYRARAEATRRLATHEAGPKDPALAVPPASRGILGLIRSRLAEDTDVPPESVLDAPARNYEEMARRADEIGATLFVSTFAGPSYGDLSDEDERYYNTEIRYLWPPLRDAVRYELDLAAYNQRMREVAARDKANVIDVAAHVRGGRDVFRDNCHLTERGQAEQASVVFDAIAPALEAILQKGAPVAPRPDARPNAPASAPGPGGGP